MCHPVSCMRKRDTNTNSQTNGSIKYVSNTHRGVMQNEILQLDNKNMYFWIFVRIFNRWKRMW